MSAAGTLASLVATLRRHPRLSAAAAGALLLAAWASLERGGSAAIPTAAVREGPFVVTVVESGVLDAHQSHTYGSTIQGTQAKILALAEEGKPVREGDLLIAFDPAPFEEQIRRSEALLAQARAEADRAGQDIKLQELANRDELAAAQQKKHAGDLRLEDAVSGSGPLRIAEAEAQEAAAERELERAESALADLRPLLAEGFITRLELEQAGQQVERARDELRLARLRRQSLDRFGRPLELSQARAEALRSSEGLGEAGSAAAYRLEQKRSALVAAESRIREANSQLAQAQDQLARCQVRADVAGLVVLRDVFFGTTPRKPRVGDQVWANQPLLVLPEISRMVVETRVRETDIHKLAREQSVTVHVAAFPDLRLTGRVGLIGTLAEPGREQAGVKSFAVTITIDQSEPRLRPGMTARVEIQAEHRPSARSVPLVAVFERNAETVCYVRRRRGFQPRPVILGPSNRDFVVIEDGLAAGETVALLDPEAAVEGARR